MGCMIGREKELCYRCLTEANDIYHLAHENRKKNAKHNEKTIEYNEKDLELEQRSHNLLDMLEDLYNER